MRMCPTYKRKAWRTMEGPLSPPQEVTQHTGKGGGRTWVCKSLPLGFFPAFCPKMHGFLKAGSASVKGKCLHFWYGWILFWKKNIRKPDCSYIAEIYFLFQFINNKTMVFWSPSLWIFFLILKTTTPSTISAWWMKEGRSNAHQVEIYNPPT